MITQVMSPTPLGVAALSIAALLVLLILLIQCGGHKDKESKNQNNSTDDGAYERIGSPGDLDNSNGNKIPECKVVVEDEEGKEKRSSTVASSTSNKSNSMERPRQPTPLPERKPSIEEDHNEKNCKNGFVAEGQVRVELETTCATAPSSNEAAGNSEPQKTVVATEGSYETSGDSLYTKVKPVAPKPECAYSVVEISNKDTEYEMVDGKLQRKAAEKKEKEKVSEYEVFNVERKADLDPVLFAVEDSGASGIYEDVPDSQVPKVIAKKVDEGLKVIEQAESKEPERLEEPKKKWGLTRFSLIKRHNKSVKDKKDSHEHQQGSPNMADKSKRKSHGSMENLSPVDGGSPRNQSKENHRRTVSSRSPRGRSEGDALPPPPPQENLRFKAENRRTLHLAEQVAEPNQARETSRRQSGPDLDHAKRPLAGVPNFYTTDMPSAADIIDGDTVYEEPDRDPSAARKKVDKWQEPSGHQPNRQQSGKWRSGSGTSPIMAHREVPKPPPLEVKLAIDDIETDETYDTISSTMNFESEADSASVEAVSSTDPQYEKVRKLPAINDGPNADTVDGPPAGKIQTTEPPYAVVDRALANKGSVRKMERQLSGGEGEPPRNGGKIEVIMRRTTISSDIRGKNEASVKHIVTESEIKACESVVDESANDTMATPVDLDALYSKVDLNKKREEEEKRALYSTANVVKTGVKTFYYGDENETIKEEFDEGHYTRIEEDQASKASSLGRQKKDLTTSDYESFEEQKTMAMFSHIRPGTGIPRSSMQVDTKAKAFTKKSDSDYEDINSFSAKMGKQTETKKPRIDDYEEIPVSPSKKEQSKNAGYEKIGYETVGNEKPKTVTKKLSADNLRQSNKVDGPNVRLPSRDYEDIDSDAMQNVTRKLSKEYNQGRKVKLPSCDYEEISDSKYNNQTGSSQTNSEDVFDIKL